MQINRPISIVIIITIVLLLVFFLVLPEYNNFKNLQTKLASVKANKNAESSYYASITKTYFDLQNHKDDIKKIDDALPENADIGGLIYYLQATAKNSGLDVKNLFLSKSSTPTAQGKNVSSIKNIVFLVSLSGDYPSLGKFINSLEQSSRLFEITSISFGSSGTPGQTSTTSSLPQFQTQQQLNFNLQINTHSY